MRPSRPAVSTIQLNPQISTLIHMTIQLISPHASIPAQALVDSGSSGNFISIETLDRLHLKQKLHSQTLNVQTIQGKPLGRGKVRHHSPTITLCVGCLHEEVLSFLVLEHSTVDVVLGRPWLTQHSPNMDWKNNEVLQWSEYCQRHCLLRVTPPTSSLLQNCSTSVESPKPERKFTIPYEYRAFQDVFSKQAATKLPPHRPWDCAIDLLPGAKLPKGRVYPLSIPEQAAMEEYIQEALRQGFICPSTSPAASSFFFVSKKDGGLRPCIDYRILNSQTVKFPYPLPLVPAALEELRGARIFSKLDLRSAYNLIRIRPGDKWKTAFITPTGHYEYLMMPYGLANSPSVFQGFMNEVFREFLHRFVIVYIDDILIYSRNQAEHRHHVEQVLQKLREYHLYLKLEKCEFHQTTIQFLGYVISPLGVQMDNHKLQTIRDWPLPSSVKELQRFLGFANFYLRFIQAFSTITAPLTSMLRHQPKSLSWSPETRKSFDQLLEAFCTAPTLAHPDPQLPFIVEVDASTVGVGVVLSQHHGEPPKLHPCAYFSRKLSPAEQNYDIGNRELLAIKLALEEWRHWLEGTVHPFQVITDHRNLEYLRDAKRLNSRQARWALFFTRFHFTVTYRPGTQNSRADALSRLHQPMQDTTEPETILPPALFVSPIEWSLDEDIRQATLTEPAPPGGPEGKTYVPTALRLSLLDSLHSSPGSGHPGSDRTLSLLQHRYWWPNIARDVSQFIRSCSVCATSKKKRHLPHGKLVPLPIPRRPWSHIGVDFITDLPRSDSYTCVLVVVDQFSKACKLIPLPRLPTAMQTAESLFSHVFRNFGIPEDIVSDRGPQFISRVWRAFFNLLGVSVSLTSGYHPQSMARLSGRSRTLGGIFGVSATRTNTAGTVSSHGPSMHRTHSVSTPLVSSPSSVYSVTNPHCSPGMGNHQKFQPWTSGSERARGSGTPHTFSSNRQSGDKRPRRMPAVYLPHHTNLAIRYGCLRGTSVSGCPVVS